MRSTKPIARRTPLKRTGSIIKRKRKILTPIQKKNSAALKKWYEDRINECTWICFNCGAEVFHRFYIFQKASQAHLLPKNIFESVATHPLNYKTLGYGAFCGCHNAYDASWHRAQKLEKWPEIQEILLKFLIPLLPPNEFSKLPDFLQQLFHESQ